MSEMTFDDAAAALAAAQNEDANASQTPASDELNALIVEPADEQVAFTTTSPTGEDAPLAPTPETPVAEESFTSIDPTLLPPELQATYKSMQAEFTRKTQAIAAERNQYTQLGPLEELQSARELYGALQDPTNWPQLHAELTAAMQDQGLSPAEAAAVATQTLEEQVAPEAAPDLKAFLDDPELSPLAKHVQSLEARLNAAEAAEQAAAEQTQLEAEQMALLGEYQRQEMAIRQSNPSYTDEDVDAIYELSSFHNGNLLQAQQRYDAMFQSRMARYVEAKRAAAGRPGLSSPTPGGGSTTAGPILDPAEAHKAGLAALAQLEAAGS